jgi:anionic cell wall polymer biosynthesis LytR-Cps2A-Psr (LCP) family protein
VAELLAQEPPPAPQIELPPDTWNIALLGVDTRPTVGGANTDVVLLASIQPSIPAVTLLSIPRDTLVFAPGWKWTKINQVFAHGGAQEVKDVFRYNFGLDVQLFAMGNFASVVYAVDTLGGIDLVATCPLYHVFPRDPYYIPDLGQPFTVTTEYVDSFTGEVWPVGSAVPTITIDMPGPGVYQLDGLQALGYARAREGLPGGDVDRGRREQKVLRSVLSKAKQTGTIAQLPALFLQFQRFVQTDIPLDALLQLANLAANLDGVRIRSVYLDEAGGLSPEITQQAGYVIVPNRDTLIPFLQQALNVSPNQLVNEDIPIEVLNGTGWEGFGLAAAERLNELGFHVVGVGNASGFYPYTQIINFETTAKGSGVPLLQRRSTLRMRT